MWDLIAGAFVTTYVLNAKGSDGALPVHTIVPTQVRPTLTADAHARACHGLTLQVVCVLRLPRCVRSAGCSALPSSLAPGRPPWRCCV